MDKGSKTREAMPVQQATEVNIDFRITIQEVHSRTGMLCDKHTHTFSFSLEHDFERAAEWLHSGDAEILFDDLCGEIGEFLGSASEDTQ